MTPESVVAASLEAAELASSDVIYLLGFAGTARGYAKLRRQTTIPGTSMVRDELQKVYVHGVGRGLGSALIRGAADAARAGSCPLARCAADEPGGAAPLRTPRLRGPRGAALR